MHSLNLSIRTYQIKSNWRTLSGITDVQSSKVIRLSKSKIKQKNEFRVKRIRGPSVSSVAQLCPTLNDPMDHSTRGFPVLHQLSELAQTHVHQVSDAIHPSHPLSSPSPPDFNLSHHQGLFQWVSSLHQVAKVLEFQLQHHSFQWIFRTDFL